MSKLEQIRTHCESCAYNDETCSMCDICLLGSNFLSKHYRQAQVTMYVAATIDGKIARHAKEICDWTPRVDKIRFKEKTKEAGVVIMGSNTFKTLSGPLPDRLNIVMTRGTIPMTWPDDNVVFTNQSATAIIHALNIKNYRKICIIGGPEIYTEFMNKGIVDILSVTLIPKVFGKGLSMFTELCTEKDLEYKSRDIIGDDCIVLEYRIKHKGDEKK